MQLERSCRHGLEVARFSQKVRNAVVRSDFSIVVATRKNGGSRRRRLRMHDLHGLHDCFAKAFAQHKVELDRVKLPDFPRRAPRVVQNRLVKCANQILNPRAANTHNSILGALVRQFHIQHGHLHKECVDFGRLAPENCKLLISNNCWPLENFRMELTHLCRRSRARRERILNLCFEQQIQTLRKLTPKEFSVHAAKLFEN